MVMPSLARDFITAKTSPTSSGSSALVGSSNRSSTGRIISARVIPTRCFSPPERRAALVPESDFPQQRLRLLRHLIAGPLLHVQRRRHQIAEHAQMWPQREMLEHHAHARTDAREFAVRHGLAAGANADPLAREEDRPAVRRLKPVDTAEQGRLAGAGRTENADGLALRHRKVDALQCLMVFEGFAQSGDLKDGNRAHA